MDLAPSAGSNGQGSVRSGSSPERALSLARVWTAVGIVLLLWFHPASPDFPIKRAMVCAVAFSVYSLILFVLLWGDRKWPNRTRIWLHSADVVWAVFFLLLTREPRAFILAFLYVLGAAAQRWSPARLLDTCAAIALLLSLALLAVYRLTNVPRPSSASYLIWGVFAFFAGGLVWHLARREAAQRSEAAAAAAQRAHSRVAVELHDSIVQSLFAVECYIERIRSNAEELSPSDLNDLSNLQDLVHKTSVKLRDIIWRERPLDLGSKSFVEYVNTLVAEFEQDTGIAVRLNWDYGKISPPSVGAGELVRILQEALLNIRKHSGARNVSIGCGVKRNWLRFWIDDDGQGFDFSGRLGMVELQSTAQGPFVIRERVSALGGELAVESKPGRGARLEIALPKDAFV
jgi:signal transduction histidine kinase